MEIIILIPLLVCAYVVYQESAQKAFLNVYLPVFALFPIYFYWKVSALPPIDFSEAALFPLGIGILISDIRYWRPSLMDLWIAIFVFTTCYPDWKAIPDNGSLPIFELFESLLTVVVPYLAGKLLIEQHRMRVATLKRLVWVLFIGAVIGSYEYRMGQNPYALFFNRFFPSEFSSYKTQIRWGFGRASEAFAQSEFAGIIYMAAFLIALYLQVSRFWEKDFKHLRWLRLNKAWTLTLGMAFTLLMTQARGPWLGCLLAIPIALIGRSKRVLRNTIVLVLIGAPAIYGAYRGIQDYSSGPVNSEAQQNAKYRTELIPNYMPIVERGGLWGYGRVFPRTSNQGSIDNAYLYLALTQGYVGLAAFCLMGITAAFSLLRTGLFSIYRHDRYFSYTLLGILFGMLLTLYTVFLGAQTWHLFFLLMGWSQSIANSETEVKLDPPWGFKRVVT